MLAKASQNGKKRQNLVGATILKMRTCEANFFETSRNNNKKKFRFWVNLLILNKWVGSCQDTTINEF